MFLQHLKLKHFLANETRKKVGKFLDLHAGTFSEITGTSFRDYKTKWGSCSPDNFLAFNIRLAMAPDDVIHYVVVHELVHIKVKNHSSRFWNAVSEIMPEYKDKRRWLRDNHHLLNYENC